MRPPATTTFPPLAPSPIIGRGQPTILNRPPRRAIRRRKSGRRPRGISREGGPDHVPLIGAVVGGGPNLPRRNTNPPPGQSNSAPSLMIWRLREQRIRKSGAPDGENLSKRYRFAHFRPKRLICEDRLFIKACVARCAAITQLGDEARKFLRGDLRGIQVRRGRP